MEHVLDEDIASLVDKLSLPAADVPAFTAYVRNHLEVEARIMLTMETVSTLAASVKILKLLRDRGMEFSVEPFNETHKVMLVESSLGAFEASVLGEDGVTHNLVHECADMLQQRAKDLGTNHIRTSRLVSRLTGHQVAGGVRFEIEAIAAL